MKGILLKLLEDHTRRTFGAESWLSCSALERVEGYLWSTEDYDDDLLERMGERIRLAAGVSRRDFWVNLGLGIFPALRAHLPLAQDAFASSVEFFLHLETMVHPAVHAVYPDAKPASIVAEVLDSETVQLRYHSDRGLCELAEGLAMAVVRDFGESGVVTQPQCRSRGDADCILRVAYGEAGADEQG